MKKRAQLTLPGLEHAASTSRDRLPTSLSCQCQCRAGSRGLCRPQLPHRRRKASSQQKGRCKRKARRKCPRRGCACFEDHLLYDHGHVAGRAFWRKGRRGEHGNRLAQSERQSVMRGIFVRLLLFGWICIFFIFRWGDKLVCIYSLAQPLAHLVSSRCTTWSALNVIVPGKTAPATAVTVQFHL